MASFNRAILMGNLCADPELKYTQTGLAVAKFSLAVNSKTKDKEVVDFFDIEVWDKQAETASQYLKKGSGVLIEGRLKQDRWEDEHGGKRSRIKIVATMIQFLPKGQGKEQGQEQLGQDDGGAPF